MNEALGGVAAAQLVGAVVGQFASTLNSPAIKMSSQRVARNASDGAGRALAPPDSNASAQLPTSIGNDDGAEFDVSFAEVGVDPHDADGGGVTTSKVVRFGLRLSSSSSSSSSSAVGNNGSNIETARVVLTLSSTAATTNATTAPTAANVSCPGGGFEGYVTFECPDGTVMSGFCERRATGWVVHEFVCPANITECAAWYDAVGAWSTACETGLDFATGATTCDCEVSTTSGESVDFASTPKSAAGLYADALTSVKPKDYLASPLVFYTLVTLFAGCALLAAAGSILDRRDSAILAARQARAPARDATLRARLISRKTTLQRESMPSFVTSLDSPLEMYLRLLWTTHSWCAAAAAASSFALSSESRHRASLEEVFLPKKFLLFFFRAGSASSPPTGPRHRGRGAASSSSSICS